MILPGAAYTEKDATYVNLEGRVQRGWSAGYPPGAGQGGLGDPPRPVRGARPDPAGELAARRARACWAKPTPSSPRPTAVTRTDWSGELRRRAATIDGAAFEPVFDSFYLTNPICRASVTMAQCVAAFAEAADKKTGTHG